MIREDTYLFLDERVAVLHALDKAVCRHLASIGRWDWAALRRHVAGCAACAPGDHRRLRDRAEHGIGWPVVFGLTAAVVISALLLVVVAALGLAEAGPLVPKRPVPGVDTPKIPGRLDPRA